MTERAHTRAGQSLKNVLLHHTEQVMTHIHIHTVNAQRDYHSPTRQVSAVCSTSGWKHTDSLNNPSVLTKLLQVSMQMLIVPH